MQSQWLKSMLVSLLISGANLAFASNALVLQTDFGTKDGAVAAMKGVAVGVDAQLNIFDLTHEIPAYNIWEASYRLYQTAEYWPKNTVFVSVVDPGVGTKRKSVVLKTKSGHYFVGPDNGSFTLVAEKYGVDSIRQINEKTNRLANSEKSYTFHGRDVYAYTGAKLAAGAINFKQVGPELPKQVVKLDYQQPKLESGQLYGNIPILDIQYGNVWTNIDNDLFKKSAVKVGDVLCIEILQDDKIKYKGKAPYVNSFGEVAEGEPLVYLNSLLNVSVALNMANFSEKFKVYSGPNWSIKLKQCTK